MHGDQKPNALQILTFGEVSKEMVGTRRLELLTSTVSLVQGSTPAQLNSSLPPARAGS
jgi:hypothetical protein